MSERPWVLFPSANADAATACCAAWVARGYRVGVVVDDQSDVPGAELVIKGGPWRGYPDAIRRLCLATKPEICVCIGDDIGPCPSKTADEIAAEFREHFPGLMGVMQACGDRFGGTMTAAVSPWIGRGWIEWAYGGKGPHWQGYSHLYCDTELQEVAKKLGVFWQRDDITQFHSHWSRGCPDTLPKEKRQRIIDNAGKDKVLFLSRRNQGFPGHEPA